LNFRKKQKICKKVEFGEKSACGLPELTLEPPLPEAQRCTTGQRKDEAETLVTGSEEKFRGIGGGAR
jgi:hypothetical protein